MKKIKVLVPILFITLALAFGFLTLRSKNVVTENKIVNVNTVNTEKYTGKTALEATRANYAVETSGTGKNAYVTSINNIKAETNKHEFWEMIVNGKSADVGAGSYIIRNGDQIEWKLSTY